MSDAPHESSSTDDGSSGETEEGVFVGMSDEGTTFEPEEDPQGAGQ
jgi:hypothetical protein